MKVVCVAVGKKHDADIAAAIDDYVSRLARYVHFEWHLIAPAKGRMGAEETRRVEAVQLTAYVKDDDYIVLLDEAGIQLASDELADTLDALDMRAQKRIVFIIGGAYGVTDELKYRSDLLWSLSKLTFPHQLVRLLLVEQLYRAYTIRRGEPYHHE